MRIYLATSPPSFDSIRCELLRKLHMPHVLFSYAYIASSERDIDYWFELENQGETNGSIGASPIDGETGISVPANTEQRENKSN